VSIGKGAGTVSWPSGPCTRRGAAGCSSAAETGVRLAAGFGVGTGTASAPRLASVARASRFGSGRTPRGLGGVFLR
jgi:hypothetical protein